MTSPDVCAQVVQSYLTHLESDFKSIESDFGCVIVTPFTRPDGEYIEIAIEPLPHDRVRLTDMGDTLGYLYVNGMTLSPSLVDSVRHISQPYRVTLDGSAFVVQAERHREFGDAMHRMIQTILSATEMIQKRRPTADAHFDSAVESLFATHNTYDTNYEVNGQREPHTVRFHVDSGRKLLIQPLSPGNENLALAWAERWAYRFGDIRAHDDSWRMFAILDDREDRAGVWTPRNLTPIEEYQVLWSRREQLQALLEPSRDFS